MGVIKYRWVKNAKVWALITSKTRGDCTERSITSFYREMNAQQK